VQLQNCDHEGHSYFACGLCWSSFGSSKQWQMEEAQVAPWEVEAKGMLAAGI